ncbi:MAG: porin family protein [Bacteroidaceae bacterium]|nr:porin family protein [Bacteroidaceae bacterium]
MKRLLAILGFAAIVCMPVSAQFSWGIRGGLNSVTNHVEDYKNKKATDKENYTGFFFGPMAELQIPIIGIGIDASLLYSQKGLQISEGDDLKNQSISVPIYAKYTFGLGNFIGIFAQAGPQFDYKLGELSSGELQSGNDVKEFVLNQYTWSFNIGAGVKLINHIQAAINYNLPLTQEGTFNLYENATTGHVGTATDQVSDAFDASTLQFILTWTF